MKRRTEQRNPALTGAVLLGAAVTTIALAACARGDEPTDDVSTAQSPTSASDSQLTAFVLPEREGPRRESTGDVPHVQLDVEPNPAVDAELRRRAFQLPGVLDLPTDRSLPGARGLALSDELDLARPDVIEGSREFAHIHPDGSLHVWLPVDRALEVHETKWGETHPWANREGFWPGVVMVYAPETLDEVDITLHILADAYNFVTGDSITIAEIP